MLDFFSVWTHYVFCLSVVLDAWCAPLLCQLSSHFRAVHTICEPKVSQSYYSPSFNCVLCFSLTFLPHLPPSDGSLRH